MDKCSKCGNEISYDEKSLTKKLISRTTTEFMCYKCLAEYFDTEEEKVRDMVKKYREMGCTLFN